MVERKFNIVVCGSARVGKSTLINAICGRQVARTSASLGSVTSKMEKYVIDGGFPIENQATNADQYAITIFDTPGIESWTKDDVQKHMTKIMQESTPVCMIYCASPGSFARLDLLQWLVDTCIQSNIFCALICTNMYCGGSAQRTAVLKDFHSLLSQYHNRTRDEANAKYYGDVALCTAVNSIVYEDRDFGVRKDVEGINELIFGIVTSLRADKQVAWCFVVAENPSFWLTMGERLAEFWNIARPHVEKFLKEEGPNLARLILPILIKGALRRL